MKLIITNTNKPGAVVHITNDEQRIESIKQRAKSNGDKVEEIKQWANQKNIFLVTLLQ